MEPRTILQLWILQLITLMIKHPSIKNRVTIIHFYFLVMQNNIITEWKKIRSQGWGLCAEIFKKTKDLLFIIQYCLQYTYIYNLVMMIEWWTSCQNKVVLYDDWYDKNLQFWLCYAVYFTILPHFNTVPAFNCLVSTL